MRRRPGVGIKATLDRGGSVILLDGSNSGAQNPPVDRQGQRRHARLGGGAMAIVLPKFGLLVRSSEPWSTLVAQWQELEALGFDSLWVADHFVVHSYEAWTALAGLASRTTRVRVGTLVTSTAFRNPAFL